MRLVRELAVHWNFFSRRFTVAQCVDGYRLEAHPVDDVAAHRLFLLCHVAMWTLAMNTLVLAASAILEGVDLLTVWTISNSVVVCDAMACLHVFLDVRQERLHEARTWEEKLARDVLDG